MLLCALCKFGLEFMTLPMELLTGGDFGKIVNDEPTCIMQEHLFRCLETYEQLPTINLFKGETMGILGRPQGSPSQSLGESRVLPLI